MSSHEGITAVTVLCLLLGMAAHGLKQLIAARRVKADITVREYVFAHWPETALSCVLSIGFYLALPEGAAVFPDIASMVGLGPKQTPLSSLVVGFVANSLADLIGGRASALTSKANPPS